MLHGEHLVKKMLVDLHETFLHKTFEQKETKNLGVVWKFDLSTCQRAERRQSRVGGNNSNDAPLKNPTGVKHLILVRIAGNNLGRKTPSHKTFVRDKRSLAQARNKQFDKQLFDGDT